MAVPVRPLMLAGYSTEVGWSAFGRDGVFPGSRHSGDVVAAVEDGGISRWDVSGHDMQLGYEACLL